MKHFLFNKVQLRQPFGNYERKSLGHILNSLVTTRNIQLRTVESVTIHWNGTINLNDKLFGKYKYFENIELPLFYIKDQYFQQNYIKLENGKLLPQFIPVLNMEGNPGFTYTRGYPNQKLYDFVTKILSKETTPEWLELNNNCWPVMRNKMEDSSDGYFFVEFCKPEGIVQWIDKLNSEYDPEDIFPK